MVNRTTELGVFFELISSCAIQLFLLVAIKIENLLLKFFILNRDYNKMTVTCIAHEWQIF